MKEYNIQKSIGAQRKYCVENSMPHFAPRNGACYSCGRNIYSEIQHTRGLVGGETRSYSTGISLEDAGSKLVTGCPHCCRSYCD